MTMRPLPLAVLLLAVAVPVRFSFADVCRTVIKSALHCVDGDPTCDLDERCDGRCVAAVCNTGSSESPRLTFCAGSLTWTSLYRGAAGRSFVARAGKCPRVKRQVWCDPAPDPQCVRRSTRTCTVSVDARTVQTAAPTTTRCLVDVYRFVSFAEGRDWSELIVQLPDEPYRARGVRGSVAVRTSVLRPGVFASDDPERPFGGITGNMGGESIPIAQVNRARLQIDEVSPKATIWSDEIHGTLDIDQSEGTRRVVLHLEF